MTTKIVGILSKKDLRARPITNLQRKLLHNLHDTCQLFKWQVMKHIYKIQACFLVITRLQCSFFLSSKVIIDNNKANLSVYKRNTKKGETYKYGSLKKTLNPIVRLQCSHNINPVSCIPNFSLSFGNHLFKMEPKSRSWKAKMKQYIYQLFYNS